MTSPIPSEPRTGHKLYHALSLGAACWLAATSAVTIYFVQSLLIGAGMLDLAASVVADLIVIGVVVGVARHLGVGLRDLGITRPRATFVLAAVLIGVSAWYVNLRLVMWIRPPGKTDMLQAVVEQTSLGPTLFGLAIMPALAEELVFRGVLARSLAPRLGIALAVVVSATVFSIYHLHASQMISTFGLGLAVGFLSLRAGSIVPAMIAHVLNNFIAILISRDEVPPLGAWIGGHPVAMFASALVVVACGLALVAKGGAA